MCPWLRAGLRGSPATSCGELVPSTHDTLHKSMEAGTACAAQAVLGALAHKLLCKAAYSTQAPPLHSFFNDLGSNMDVAEGLLAWSQHQATEL